MPCTPELLADVELFAHMNDEDRARLAQFIGARELPAGTLLFQAGQPGEAMYVVKRGEIELYIKDNAGQKIALATVGAGQVFGEMALLDHGPRTATARALEDSELLELDRESLLLLFKTTPTAALSLLAAVSHMTRKADELLRQRVSRNAKERGSAQQGRTPHGHQFVGRVAARLASPDQAASSSEAERDHPSQARPGLGRRHQAQNGPRRPAYRTSP